MSAKARQNSEAGAVALAAGSVGTAEHLLSVLQTVMTTGEGSTLLAAIDGAIPFVRAIVVAAEHGVPRVIACSLVSDKGADCSGIVMSDLLDVRCFSVDDAARAPIAALLSPDERGLSLPVACGGCIGIAVLIRTENFGDFSGSEIAAARLLSAGALTSYTAQQHRMPSATTAAHGAELDDLQLVKIVLDHLPISLTVQDGTGRFVLANAIAAADLAVPVDRLVGCSPSNFLSEDEAASRREWEQSVLTGGKTITAEARVRDAEGERILLTSHTPVSITNNTLLISSSVDITEHKEAERRLAQSVHIDKLTGLPDRVQIEQHVDALVSNDRKAFFALAFIDLDNFKHINDYYSHTTGDALLVKTGERIRKLLKPADMLARISGDEFVLLLSGYDTKESIEPAIEEVLAEVKKPFYIEGFEIFSSCSIGVSFHPAHGTSYETLRRNADGAMYGAKGRAKGTAVYFDDGLGKAIAVRMEAEQRLRLAIRDRRFVCAFQPKVDIHTGDVIGFETLVRWRDSDGEIHPPGHFIGLAIELGLINPITNFVLQETLNSIDRLDAAFGSHTSVSINVGAKQTSDLGFMRALVESMKASGYAKRLILEITEDAIVEKGVFQSEILPMLRGIGVRISIDDFGTGYSSLSALADITADEIKIDRSFISGIHERPRSQSVLKAIESLAHSLGMSIVAEGVETHEELVFLQAATRIRLAQGFYFSKPIYLDEMNSGVKVGGRTIETRGSAPSRTSGMLRAPARSG